MRRSVREIADKACELYQLQIDSLRQECGPELEQYLDRGRQIRELLEEAKGLPPSTVIN